MVEAGGDTVSLEEAIGKGIVSLSGVAEPASPGERGHTRFNAVRIYNLTGEAVVVRVERAVVLGIYPPAIKQPKS